MSACPIVAFSYHNALLKVSSWILFGFYFRFKVSSEHTPTTLPQQRNRTATCGLNKSIILHREGQRNGR